MSLTPPLHISIRDLGPTLYHQGWTRWHLMLRPHDGVAHRLDDTLRPGYFNDCSARMAEGDFIDVSAHDGGGTLYVTRVRPARTIAGDRWVGMVEVVMMVRTP